jgi:hypothetical protein
MSDLSAKIDQTEQYIQERLTEFSEAQKLDYYRRVSLAHSAYSQYSNAEMYRNLYENTSKYRTDGEFLKFIPIGAIAAILIDWLFFNFSGWSIGVTILLLPICAGISTLSMQFKDERAFRVSYWMHENIKAGSLAAQSGVGLYEIKKAYTINEEYVSPNIKEIKTDDDALAFSGEKEYAAQLQWNKIYLAIQGAIDKTRT